MVDRNDETGFEEPERARARRLLFPKIEERMDREHVRQTIESAGWEVFWRRIIKPQLDEWKRDLLTRTDLPEGERRGLISARTVLLEGILTFHERTGAQLPSYLQDALKEANISYERD